MKGEKEMEVLVVLYFIDLTVASVGEGKVSVLDLAKWFMVSKPTVVSFVAKMIENGLVSHHIISAKTGNGFIVKYSITLKGKQHLDNNYDAAYDLYRIQVAKVIAAIQSRKPAEEYYRLTAKEKRQIDAGQRDMFGNE